MGHVHVYQLLMIRGSDEYLVDPLYFARRTIEMSGWTADPSANWNPSKDAGADLYEGSVGDRSGTAYISVWATAYNDPPMSLLVMPHRRFTLNSSTPGEKRIRSTGEEGEREQGIAYVNALLLGKSPLVQRRARTMIQNRMEALLAGTASVPGDWSQQMQDDVLLDRMDAEVPLLYGETQSR